MTRAAARPWVGLLAILGAAAVFRLAVANHSLWFDEQAAVFFSDQPFARLWSDWMLRETNPALYYSLLRAWRMVAGSSDLAVRALSVAASLAAITFLFAAARRAYGTRAALFAAGLAALSGEQLYFAEQARAYVFVLCTALVAIDALLAFITSDDRAARWRAAAVYAIAATTAIYLHTTMLLFPAVASVAVILADPRRHARAPSLLLPLVVADVFVLLAAGWAVREALIQLLHHRDNITPIGLADGRLIAVYPLQTLFLSGHPGKMAYGIAALVLALVVAFAVWDRRRRATRLIAAIGIMGVAIFGVVGLFVPVFVPRTIFWISAVPLLLAGGALARLPVRPRWAAFAVLAALLVTDTVRVAPRLETEDWNTPVHLLSERPGALLLVQGEAMAVLADSDCRRQLRLSTCPYGIIAVTDPDDRFDTWAQGSFAGPQVSVVDLPDRVAGRTIFLFRKADYHNLPTLLHRHGLGHGLPADDPAFMGPLPAAALR